MERIPFIIYFIREKQSQYHLEMSKSVQKRLGGYKMESKFQIRKMHQDYYTENEDTLKKVHYTRNRPKIREAQKTITVITKVKPMRLQEVIL